MFSKKISYSSFIFIIIFLTSIAAPVNQFKVPPVMPVLMSEFDLSLASAGMLMSVFALVGMLLALPSGCMVHRLGLKKSGIIALFALGIGSAAGLISGSSSSLMLSRIIEGIGMCLISVMAPASIAAWFPPEKRGLPMGIWATWVPLGTILMFLVAPALNSSFGWRSIWLITGIYTFAILIALSVFFRTPSGTDANTCQKEGQIQNDSNGNPYYNRDIWLLAGVFMVFNIAVISICTFMPSFLENVRDFSPEKASAVSGLFLAGALVIGPVTGIIANRIGSYKKILFIGVFVSAAGMCLPFIVSSSLVPVVLFLLGMATGTVPPVTFSSAAEIMKLPSRAGTGMSIVAFGQYTGMCIGPAMFGEIAENFGWASAGYSLVPIMMLSSAVIFLIRVK